MAYKPFNLSNYKDVDDTVAGLINQFYNLRDAGRYNDAHDLIVQNKNMLEPYFINAASFNKIELGIYNLAKEVMYKQKTIISPTEPDIDAYQISLNSEWLQEY